MEGDREAGFRLLRLDAHHTRISCHSRRLLDPADHNPWATAKPGCWSSENQVSDRNELRNRLGGLVDPRGGLVDEMIGNITVRWR